MHVAVNTRSGTNGPSLVTRSCYDSALISLACILVPATAWHGDPDHEPVVSSHGTSSALMGLGSYS